MPVTPRKDVLALHVSGVGSEILTPRKGIWSLRVMDAMATGSLHVMDNIVTPRKGVMVNPRNDGQKNRSLHVRESWSLHVMGVKKSGHST